MESISHIQQIISDTFGRLDFSGTPAELYDPIAYTMSLGGKRLRPALVLAACDLYGGNISEAIHPAVGIELFHNFTLLHDDLMDQAPLRRGKETVYRKWNANIAILAGDTLFALAGKQMLKTRMEAIPGILELFNTTAVEVCEGQQLDMNFESRNDVSLGEYIEMIRLKTAVLLAASLKTGALVAGADAKQCRLIYDFGISMGIAFQLMDDLLDVYGSEDKFGKVTGGDIVTGKKTFLFLKAMELSGDRREEFASLYQDVHADSTGKVKKVKDVFDKLDIRTATIHQIDLYWERAVALLKSSGLAEDAIAPLLSYCAGLMQRDY